MCLCDFLNMTEKAAAVCKSTERLKVKKWRDTTGWDRYTIPQTWNERMWKHRKKKNIHKWEWKKGRVIFSKVCSTRLLLLPTRPADSTQHTTSQAKTHNPVSPLSHTARHITNPFTCTSTHSSLLYLAWSVKERRSRCMWGVIFCLFVWSPCQLPWIWSLEGRKERKVNEKWEWWGGRLIYGNDWLMFLLGFSQWEAAECLHPHSIAKVSDWVQSDK